MTSTTGSSPRQPTATRSSRPGTAALRTHTVPYLLAFFVTVVCLSEATPQVAMWGFDGSRNMVAPTTGALPTSWNTETGEGILWSVELGSQTYGGPLVVGDRIYVGTNNQGLRNPALTGDRGNLMAFERADGRFLWQTAHPKLPAGRVNDWPLQGICSTPYVEGDRLYYVSNRCELVCVDADGFLDGENDGPCTAEEDTSAIDGDFVWKLDMIDELNVFPHNLATRSPVGAGNLIFLLTSNGVDEGHVHIPSPFAPSFVAVDKRTGEGVWEDASPGMNILHGQWSNPAYGAPRSRAQVIMPGGDGWVYSFAPESGDLLWKFDLNPKDAEWRLGGRGTRNNIISTPVIVGDRVYLGVGQDPEHGEGVGHLYCIDATGSGDVTDSGAVWHLGGDDFHRTMSTAAVQDGLLYIADLSGFVYCLDAATGEKVWTYDTFAAIWGSPMVADGKVYIGDEDGELTILKTGRTLEVLAELDMGSAVYPTPVPVDDILYVATRNRLFAISGTPE